MKFRRKFISEELPIFWWDDCKKSARYIITKQVQVKTWFGWITFKTYTFNTYYEINPYKNSS